MKTRDRAPSGRGASVREDWCTCLSEDKFAVFQMYHQQLEAAYQMFSVSLNEAIELAKNGHVTKSYQAVTVTPALCSRLAQPTAALLHALADHSKHYGTVPNAAPLNATNFRGSKEQRSARMSAILSRVLLSQRAQFLHKINTLCELVEDLSRDFSEAAYELAEGAALDPGALWTALDAGHYDLNTCFRETAVLLKSFLVALPDRQLLHFEKSVLGYMQTAAPHPSQRGRMLRDRRLAQFAGE